MCVSPTATIKHKVEQCNRATERERGRQRETETKCTGSHMNVIYKCKYLPLWHNRKWATSWQICCVNIYIHIHIHPVCMQGGLYDWQMSCHTFKNFILNHNSHAIQLKLWGTAFDMLLHQTVKFHRTRFWNTRNNPSNSAASHRKRYIFELCKQK